MIAPRPAGRPGAAWLFALLLAVAAAGPRPARGQIVAADSAAVILETARTFEDQNRWDVAEALYRMIVARFSATPAAVLARARLDSPPEAVVYGSGQVELQVWMTLYGAWLGIAVPGAFGADSPEPFGVGLLLGAPTGFLAGRGLARALSLTEGQARALTLGGTWGTWQGYGWREVFELGTGEVCEPDPFAGGEYCFETEDSSEEAFAAMIVGGLVGVGAGALLSNRDITPGTGTTVNFGSLWGTWFGFAAGVLSGLEDDDLLASTLIGGDVGLAATAILAPGWNVSRSRARLVSIAGVLGGLGGAGLDLIALPDDEKAAVAIPLAGSLVGLVVAALATRGDSTRPSAMPEPSGSALLRYRNGRLGLGTAAPLPTLVPVDGPNGTRWKPALALEIFRGSF